MCSVTSLLTSLIPGSVMYMWQDKNYDKAKKQTKQQIDKINQEANKQIENNKIANSVQTTNKQTNTQTDLKKTLPIQKTPLNSMNNTGVSTVGQSALGLNLGGY